MPNLTRIAVLEFEVKYFKYYIPPPIVEIEGYTYATNYRSYSEYNYLRPGIVSYIRSRHFDTVLKFTSHYFHKCNVIDFACADGVFLPSLARYFNHVVGIDANKDMIKLASKLVSTLDINDEIQLVNNLNLSISDIRSRLSHEYHILYLLELLEHIGDKSNLWEAKIEFLKDLFTLIDDRGIIVISVPKMVGISFLIQRLGLTVFNLNREPISINDLLRASIFSDTRNLEERFDEGHIGFNHKKLESYLRSAFHVLQKKNEIFQVLYIIAKSHFVQQRK
ncbi:class I SAM-dependent methyltransferase [Chloroflexota bacterium]